MKTNRHFLITSRPILFYNKKASHKIYREKQNTHFVFSNYFFFSKVVTFIWDNVEKNIVQPDRSQTTLRLPRIACRIPKATNTHSEYVTFIAFLIQRRWLPRIACRIPKATNTHSEYVTFIAFLNTTTVSWTRLSITLYVNFPHFCDEENMKNIYSQVFLTSLATNSSLRFSANRFDTK